MDLRLSKRTPTDNLLELYLPESPLLEKTEDTLYESPALEKRDNMLRLSKRDLLRLSKRDLLRLSKRDLLRLSKRAEEARNKTSNTFDLLLRDFFVGLFSSLWWFFTRTQTEIYAWVNGRNGPRLIGKPLSCQESWTRKTNQRWALIKHSNWSPPAKVPMIIRLSKRDLSRLLNEGSLEGAGRELRLSKRAFEVVNWVQLPVPWNELFSCPACVVDRPSHYWVKSGVCTPWNKSPDQPIYIFISPIKRFFTLTGNWAKMLFKFVVQSSRIVDQQKQL